MGEWSLCCELEVTKPGMKNNGMVGKWILCCELEVSKPGMKNNGMVGEWSFCCKSEVTKPGIGGSRWGWGGGDKSYFILLSVRIHQARNGG